MNPLGNFLSHIGMNKIEQTKQLANTSELAVPFWSLDTFYRNFWKGAICI